MAYKVIKSKYNGYFNSLVLETVEQKPDIETVMWFSLDKSKGLIPRIAHKDRILLAYKGVLNTEFRKTQYELFKQYYNLTDSDDVPYKHPYKESEKQ